MQTPKLIPTAFAAIVLALCFSSSASAASYSVYACQGPAAQALPNSAWLTSVNNPAQTLSFAFGAVCGDLSVNLSSAETFAQGDGAAYVFDPPSGTTISGYDIDGYSFIDFATGGSHPSFSAGVREIDGSSRADFGCDQSTIDCTVDPNHVIRSGLALTRLSVGVFCTAEDGCGSIPFNDLSAALTNARVDIEDPSAPEIVAVSGSLPGSSGAAGQQTLDVTATDVGGGVASVAVSIDGHPAQTISSGGSCGEPYTLRQPCPSGVTPRFTIDTSALVDGAHTATIVATDAAGNESNPTTFAFNVSSGGAGPKAANGNPAVSVPTIRMVQSTVLSKGGRAAILAGRLTTSSGAPIAGATLEVSALDLGVYDAQERSLSSVTTDAAGGFSMRVGPSGARRFTFSFRPAPGAGITASASAVLRENLALTIRRSKARVKPRGLLTLSGRLSGAGSAAGGAPVEIDVKIGKRWRAVGVVDTSSRGSWKWRYRFTRVEQPTRFYFRAQVRRTTSWPWPTTLSSQTKVLVAR
ncbi:MAG: hypothetical protein QM648_06455 [Solirubrobacterales bacterium]